MGARVGKFVADAGRAVAKGAISFVGGKIPVIGPILANKINEQFAQGGKVMGYADGGVAGPKMVVNTPSQLISLIKKAPELAQKAGLTVAMVKDAVAKAKEGEMTVAKRRGGMMKKEPKGEDKVMLRTGDAVPHFARGGRVMSVF